METYDFITVQDVANMLHLTKGHVYNLMSQKKIPYYKPSQKALFKRSEILAWINGTRIKPIDEI